MDDTQILSTLERPGSQSTPKSALGERTLVFDACHISVVLRAVLFIELVLGVSALFVSDNWSSWLVNVAVFTGAALPATLIWLLAACSMKKILEKFNETAQYAAGITLGILSGIYSYFMLIWTGLLNFNNSNMLMLACAAMGGLLSTLMVAALVMRARARTPAATSARLTELQSRIRPHFLFNTLNSAIALVREEPAKAETLLEDLSELFRSALVEFGESANLGQELELARHYLSIEQVRFGERLHVDWRVDPRADIARLPPLLLQPLVENAVKHGVENNENTTLVLVETQRRGKQVRIDIVNSLPENYDHRNTSSKGHGIALSNVRDRLRLLHDFEAQFSAGVRQGRYQVRIVIPIG